MFNYYLYTNWFFWNIGIGKLLSVVEFVIWVNSVRRLYCKSKVDSSLNFNLYYDLKILYEGLYVLIDQIELPDKGSVCKEF